MMSPGKGSNWNDPLWYRATDRFGLPTLLLLLLCFGIYKFASWGAPLVEKEVSKHVEFLDALKGRFDEIKKESAESLELQRRAIQLLEKQSQPNDRTTAIIGSSWHH